MNSDLAQSSTVSIRRDQRPTEWAESRARALPGVRFTAAFEHHRSTWWFDGKRMHQQIWSNMEEETT